MTIQTINRGMANRAYQTNNQTMPMAKTNNANSSPVADSNITYSLYGKNSSGGTVAFAGLGSSIAGTVKKSVTDGVAKRTSAFEEKLASAIEKIKSEFGSGSVEKFKSCVSKLENYTAKDGSRLFEGNEAVSVAEAVFRDKHNYPATLEKVLNIAPRFAEMTGPDGKRLLQGENLAETIRLSGYNLYRIDGICEVLPKLAEMTGKDGKRLLRDDQLMSVAEYAASDTHNSPEKFLKLFSKVAELTRKDGKFLFDFRNTSKDAEGELQACKDCVLGLLVKSKSPEKAVEFFPELINLVREDGQPLIRRSALAEIAASLTKTAIPEKAIKLIPIVAKIPRINNGYPNSRRWGEVAVDLACSIGKITTVPSNKSIN